LEGSVTKRKIFSVFGTRPEAIKMAPVIRALLDDGRAECVTCVTGQHRQMLDQVLDLFDIRPDYDLDIMVQSQTLSHVTCKVLEKLEAMTSVCSVGLDMVAIPGDTPAETIAAIIADEMAIGVINDKTTAVRLIPVPGAKAGEMVDFGGLFGSTPVMEVRNSGASAAFVRFGGRIPAPMQSLRN